MGPVRSLAEAFVLLGIPVFHRRSAILSFRAWHGGRYPVGRRFSVSGEPKPLADRIAVITGGSSGIGAATARLLAERGARVILGARRSDRLEAERQKIALAGGEAEALVLDVAERKAARTSSGRCSRRHGGIDILVNSAGLARGFEPVLANSERDWREMIEANVMGLMRMTRAFLPAMIARKGGDIVHVGSIAGLEPYAKGAAYCASKAAVEAFVHALRLELVGTRIRQLVIEPGMVETEFSVVRFHGDKPRADAVYQGLVPLSAEDVAECIAFALARPAHVCIQTLLGHPDRSGLGHRGRARNRAVTARRDSRRAGALLQEISTAKAFPDSRILATGESP